MTCQTCDVCTNNFNKTINRQVDCPYCDFKTCKTCCETYILSSIKEPHCMNCKKEWSRSLLIKQLSYTFVNTKFKKHQELILFEKERSLLPATQLVIEERREKNIIRQTIHSLRIEFFDLSMKLNELSNQKILLNKQIKTIQKKIQENNIKNNIKICELSRHITILLESKYALIRDIRSINEQLARKFHEIDTLQYQLNHVKKNNTFVRKCNNNGCKGFLSTQLKCGVCEHWGCAECHEVKGLSKDEPHVCKNENIETVKLLKKDSKGCPSCGTYIFKTEGCDQMFCTQCHTAFSWNTGKLETTIHNPHYFEWLRESGKNVRNIQEIQCGRNIDANFISLIPFNKWKKISFLSANIVHLRDVTLAGLVWDSVNNNNEELRIEYLLNKIDESTFKTMLQREDKKTNKKKDMANIVGTVVHSITDIIYRYVNETSDDFSQFEIEISNLRNYTNNELKIVSELYKNKQYQFSELFILN